MTSKIHLMTTSSFKHEGQLSQSDQIIWDALMRRGVAGQCFSPNDVSVMFTDDICVLYVRNVALDPCDTLLIRSTRGAPERAYEVARIFESLGGCVSDPVATLAYAAGKLLPYVARRGNVPYIASYFFNTATTTLEQVLVAVSYPFILKPQSGFQGKGVALINSAPEYEAYVAVSDEPSLMAQNYLADIVDEFRVVVIGGKGIGVVRKDRTASDIDPFNADHDTDVAVNDIEVLVFAELAAKVGGGDVYGADVVRTSTGALYLIENNRCPNIVTFREATQVSVEDKLIDFLLR